MTDSSFFFKKPKESPGLLLWQVTTLWQKLIKKSLEPYEITHPQFTLMAILLWLEENNQTPTQATLAQFSKLDKMTISQALKPLTSKGYLKRREHPMDTRAKLVSLTVEGKRLTTQLVSIVESIDRDLFCSVDETDQEQLKEILNKIISHTYNPQD
ncbi:hypothetical protein IM40_00815 [Candidatus Paracaedimonas acanthamoebae]|nr:hypothetical protein IM40_00815 [Candidatus Paracaedimonas acanthamoebae]